MSATTVPAAADLAPPLHPTLLGTTFGIEPSQFGLAAVIDVRHHLGDGAVPSLLGDQAGHALRDGSVGGVPLRRAAELDEVHRLPGVHVHHESELVGQRHGVGGFVWVVLEQTIVERVVGVDGTAGDRPEPGR